MENPSHTSWALRLILLLPYLYAFIVSIRFNTQLMELSAGCSGKVVPWSFGVTIVDLLLSEWERFEANGNIEKNLMLGTNS